MTEKNPPSRRLGDARVSTYGQTLDAQLAQLRADGCAPIYQEKASGAQPTRREVLRMLKALGPDDVVTVTRIDRLARSTFDLFAIVKQIVDAKGQFRSLAEPWADTATSTGRLMIAVLAGLADVEHDLIRTPSFAAVPPDKASGYPPLSRSRTAHRWTQSLPCPLDGRNTAIFMSLQSIPGPLIESKSQPGMSLPTTTAALPTLPISFASKQKVFSAVIGPSTRAIDFMFSNAIMPDNV